MEQYQAQRAFAIRRHRLLTSPANILIGTEAKINRTPALARVAPEYTVVDLWAFKGDENVEGLIEVHQPDLDPETFLDPIFPFGNTTPVRFAVKLRELTADQINRVTIEMVIGEPSVKEYRGLKVDYNEDRLRLNGTSDLNVILWGSGIKKAKTPYIPVELAKAGKVGFQVWFKR